MTTRTQAVVSPHSFSVCLASGAQGYSASAYIHSAARFALDFVDVVFWYESRFRDRFTISYKHFSDLLPVFEQPR